MNIFKDTLNFLRHLFSRPGMQDFLKREEKVALEAVGKLVSIHGASDFHAWRDDAWTAVRDAVAPGTPGNWITILVALAFETFKAKEPPQA